MFESDSVARCAAMALSKATGASRLVLNVGGLKPTRWSASSIIVLSETNVRFLTTFRLAGFRGGVLVLSNSRFADLREHYRILRWGQGSHDSCVYPLLLEDLISRSSNLLPLNSENFRMLQAELKTAPNVLVMRMSKAIKRLKASGGNDKEAYESVREAIRLIQRQTPVAYHADVTVNGQHAQLQDHLRRSLHDVGIGNRFAVDALNQCFSEWRKLIDLSGETLLEVA